jgi:hypothetical protein
MAQHPQSQPVQAATRGRRPTGGRRPPRAAVGGPATNGRRVDGRPAVAYRETAARPAVTRPWRPAITDLWAEHGRPPRPAVGDRPSAGAPLCPPPAPLAQPLCPQNFAHAVNSSSLAAAHARPAQTSPSNFKHP